MSKKTRIFGTGTMRSGGSLVSNILGLSSEVKVFTEVIYFARHVFKSNLNFKNSKVLLFIASEMSNRIYYRNGINIPATNFYVNFIKYKLKNTSDLYERILFTFLEHYKQINKKIVLEYSNGEWRFIENFLKLNKRYKAFHIIRDPRAIISSFKKITFSKGYEYFFPIFNWIDSYNYYLKYKKKYNSKRYLFIKFEDIHLNPVSSTKKILSFADLRFKRKYLQKNFWKKKLNKNQDYINFSAYTKKKQYAFNKNRINKWQSSLEDWEISLIQNLLSKPMEKLDYYKINFKNDKKLFSQGLKNIKTVPIFRERLNNMLKKNEGTNLKVNDPKDPINWSSRYDPRKKFFNDKEYKIFINNYKKIMELNK